MGISKGCEFMRKKAMYLLVFMIFSMAFLTACSQKIQLHETSGGGSTIYENDNIKIKIVDNIDEKENVCKIVQEDLQKINDFSPIENIEIEISKVYVAPSTNKIIKCDDKFIETEEFKKELIKKSYGIYDNWIVEGLYGNIFNKDKKGIDFSEYYENHDFSLFGARFFEPFSSKEEIENIKSASTNLVEYLLKHNKKAELLKNNIKISDMENWAREKNINLDYQKKIESLMNRMEVLNKKGHLVINTKEEINGFKIDIPYTDKVSEQYDTAEKIEDIILRFDKDILNIKQGIEKDAPSFYLKYKELLNDVPKVEYVFEYGIDGGYTEPYSKVIHLKDMTAQPHEYCHLLFDEPFLKNGISVTKPAWLDEGIANYLDAAYAEACIEAMKKGISMIEDYHPATIEEQNLYNIKLKIFRENNIDINSIESIENIKDDKEKRILLNNVTWLAQAIRNRETEYDTWFIDKRPYPGPMGEGNTMSYHENFSFVNYLIEEYGLEKILYLNVADFSQLTYEKVFGKSFEELKTDWTSYLKENIKDIELLLNFEK